MYASQLWCNFRKSCMQRLRVAYNFGCRVLYNLPWRASVSSHHVQCNIPTFEALLRKYTYLFLERCRKSNNIWLRALMQSSNFTPQVKEARNQSPIFARKSISRNTTHRQSSKAYRKRRAFICALMQSDYLYSSLFFEHYNRILLCEWVMELCCIRLIDGVSCQNAFAFYLDSTNLGIGAYSAVVL